MEYASSITPQAPREQSMCEHARMNVSFGVRVVDPSLFTIPYDEALVGALRRTGVEADLVGRPAREDEPALSVPFSVQFYRYFDTAPRRLGPVGAALKALEHCWDSFSFAKNGAAGATLGHFQWLPFPLMDKIALMRWRKRGPIVITVHDTAPFNGTPTSRLQLSGFVAALGVADGLIVHTQTGKKRLMEYGLDPARIQCIPHGPLGQSDIPMPTHDHGPMTLVAFGKIRPYKGIDILIEAMAMLDANERQALKVIVAGEPMMDMAPLLESINVAGLTEQFEIIPEHLDDGAMQTLFARAEAFVFSYREIEASGVLFLVQGLGRWIVASRLGAFAETIEDGLSGRLVPAADAGALADALRECAKDRPRPSHQVQITDWDTIAHTTVELYKTAFEHWQASVPTHLRSDMEETGS